MDLNLTPVPSQSTDDEFSYDSNFSSPDKLASPSLGSSTPHTKVHHPRYYIKDDMTVFLVNGILFRVHRHYLDRESEIFREYPSGTEENPVPLPDVLQEEFEALVEYFYDSVHDDISRSSGEWRHLLSISTRFKMDKVRNRAIREIRDFPLDPVDKIVLAVKNNIPEWLKPAYVELCQREEPIREEEAEKLGLGTAMKLARAREYVRDPMWVVRNPAPKPPPSVPSIGWGNASGWGNTNTTASDISRPPSPPDTGPAETRRDMAHVNHVVTYVFWPSSVSGKKKKMSQGGGKPWLVT
jgi:hypothetical protein